MQLRRSAEPDLEVEALLPCLARRRRLDARIEEVVLMLNVLCESPPVPTISHCKGVWQVSFSLLVRHRRDPLSVVEAAIVQPIANVEHTRPPS